MIGFRRPGPLAQMTLALVTMTISVVLLAEVLLGAVSDRDRERQALRAQQSEALAVLVASLLEAGQPEVLERSLRDVLRRQPQLQSIGVRRRDDVLVATAGPHQTAWPRGEAGRSTLGHVQVSLTAGGVPWGAVEVAYVPDTRTWWVRAADSSLLRLVLFVAIAGAIGYALYLRRALQHLDPAAVIPERVQRAFDAMGEGLVVLDARARVLLTNKAFRELHPDVGELRLGQTLASVPWLASALPTDPAAHPWARAMAAGQNSIGERLAVGGSAEDIARGDPEARELAVNCAPITDRGGAVRGCMVTFGDVTELQRANGALRRALADLQAGREELQRSNRELERLVTRDVLTGTLSRRAFMGAAERAIERAVREGTPLGCLMLDIDHFKAVNDNHGHGIGDRVIAEVGRVLLSSAREGDLVGRYGGEEFCVLAVGAERAALWSLADRIRRRAQDEAGGTIAEVPGLVVTVSAGAAAWLGAGETLPELLERADRALYHAKRTGRNRVAEFTTDAQEPAASPG